MSQTQDQTQKISDRNRIYLIQQLFREQLIHEQLQFDYGTEQFSNIGHPNATSAPETLVSPVF